MRRALRPGKRGAAGKRGRPLARHAPHVRGEPGAKPFVDDLLLGRGFVRSRAAPSLRSIESQPSTQGFVAPGADAATVAAAVVGGGCRGRLARLPCVRLALPLSSRPIPPRRGSRPPARPRRRGAGVGGSRAPRPADAHGAPGGRGAGCASRCGLSVREGERERRGKRARPSRRRPPRLRYAPRLLLRFTPPAGLPRAPRAGTGRRGVVGGGRIPEAWRGGTLEGGPAGASSQGENRGAGGRRGALGGLRTRPRAGAPGRHRRGVVVCGCVLQRGPRVPHFLRARGVDQLSRPTRARVRGPAGSTSCPGRLGPGSEGPRGRPAVPADSGPGPCGPRWDPWGCLDAGAVRPSLPTHSLGSCLHRVDCLSPGPESPGQGVSFCVRCFLSFPSGLVISFFSIEIKHVPALGCIAFYLARAAPPPLPRQRCCPCIRTVRRFLLVFGWPHPRSMELPRLGVELELRLLAYARAAAVPDLSLVSTPCVRRRMEPATSWSLVRFVSSVPRGKVLNQRCTDLGRYGGMHWPAPGHMGFRSQGSDPSPSCGNVIT